jgi:hypothetical protein
MHAGRKTRHNRCILISNEFERNPPPGQPVIYQIRIHGHLSREWTDWIDGMTITLDDNGDTLLTGPVVDQAALHGLLKMVRDLGIPLLSLVQIQNQENQKGRRNEEKNESSQ